MKCWVKHGLGQDNRMCPFSAGTEYDQSEVLTLSPLLRLLPNWRGLSSFGRPGLRHPCGGGSRFQIQGRNGNWAAGVGMAFETHGPAGPEVQSASDVYVLQVVWRSKRDATLPHYDEKRESCCSLTEPNRSQEFYTFAAYHICVDITPDSQIRLQATQRFLQRGGRRMSERHLQEPIRKSKSGRLSFKNELHHLLR
jgi:hypothetical protein